MSADKSTSATRVIGRPFPKGKSGNPGGVPAGIPQLVMEARRLALSYAPQAIERLAFMLDDPDGRVVVAAATGLLDRAGLRPYSLEPERVEVASTVDVEALRAVLAARLARLADGPVVEALPPEQLPAAHVPAPPEGNP
jgi:hypothetical protein